ncbi:PREDICTED: uncharacterized protein LOC106147323 isoform X2 [Chinchilla lanigera]|uniref:uncharacterized protein LOC106147323 isoform X2 n=1 Tax=Chinchilla lanigera TaxID=34839 RepID=UPI000695A7EB|nr:PREDICTED: uncharacterized protein LOC106147323 isoform X2 [Chinchilla lanigera]
MQDILTSEGPESLGRQQEVHRADGSLTRATCTLLPSGAAGMEVLPNSPYGMPGQSHDYGLRVSLKVHMLETRSSNVCYCLEEKRRGRRGPEGRALSCFLSRGRCARCVLTTEQAKHRYGAPGSGQEASRRAEVRDQRRLASKPGRRLRNQGLFHAVLLLLFVFCCDVKQRTARSRCFLGRTSLPRGGRGKPPPPAACRFFFGTCAPWTEA